MDGEGVYTLRFFTTPSGEFRVRVTYARFGESWVIANPKYVRDLAALVNGDGITSTHATAV